MTETIAIVAVVILFVVFGLFHKNRGCPGPDACGEANGTRSCAGCPLTSEKNHA